MADSNKYPQLARVEEIKQLLVAAFSGLTPTTRVANASTVFAGAFSASALGIFSSTIYALCLGIVAVSLSVYSYRSLIRSQLHKTLNQALKDDNDAQSLPELATTRGAFMFTLGAAVSSGLARGLLEVEISQMVSQGGVSLDPNSLRISIVGSLLPATAIPAAVLGWRLRKQRNLALPLIERLTEQVTVASKTSTSTSVAIEAPSSKYKYWNFRMTEHGVTIRLRGEYKERKKIAAEALEIVDLEVEGGTQTELPISVLQADGRPLFSRATLFKTGAVRVGPQATLNLSDLKIVMAAIDKDPGRFSPVKPPPNNFGGGAPIASTIFNPLAASSPSFEAPQNQRFPRL